jgi:hypothetical protein
VAPGRSRAWARTSPPTVEASTISGPNA